MPFGTDTASVDLIAGSNKSRILLEKFHGLILTVISHLLLPAPASVLSCPMARVRMKSRERSFVEIPAFHWPLQLMQSRQFRHLQRYRPFSHHLKTSRPWMYCHPWSPSQNRPKTQESRRRCGRGIPRRS